MSYKIMLIVLCSSILIPILTGPLSHTSGPVLCKLTKYYMSFFNVTLKRTKKIHEWHTKYGPVVCVGPSEISVASPPLMKEIYGYADKYDKSEFFDNFLAYGERPVFAVRDCQEHRQKRRLIAPFYRAASKPWIVKMVDTRVSALLSQIKEREQQHVSLDVFPVLSYYAFDNISELLLGARNCAHALNGERDTCQILDDLKHTQVWGPLVFDFPRVSAVVQRVLRALKLLPASLDAEERLSDWSRQKIHEAFCGKGPEEGTLLYHLVNTRDAKGEALCMDYIASELYDNLNAAQVTVAVTLVYIIYNLSKHHVWQSKLRKEILDLVTEGHESPTFADVEKARVLEAIIRETYRLNPGTGGHAERVVPDGGKLYSGVYVPERVRVTASTMALHYDPEVFPRPEEFCPERWLHGDVERLRMQESSLIPFGYGPRICVGKLFATIEIKLFIARLYLSFTTEVDPSSQTSAESMRQIATHDSVPRGLRCDIKFSHVDA